MEPLRITACCTLYSRLNFYLSDGRNVSLPISWFPRLDVAAKSDLAAFTICSDGQCVEWKASGTKVTLADLLKPEPSAPNRENTTVFAKGVSVLRLIDANARSHGELWWHPTNWARMDDVIASGDVGEIEDFLTDIKDWATHEGMSDGPDWWQEANLSKRVFIQLH